MYFRISQASERKRRREKERKERERHVMCQTQSISRYSHASRHVSKPSGKCPNNIKKMIESISEEGKEEEEEETVD